MCPLFVMFESRLKWDSPNPFFFCSHVLSIFLFWSWLNWDPPHTILSLLSCVLSLSLVLFGPGLTGTHTCFSGMHVLGWFRCPDSQQLLSLHRIHPFIASHVSLFVMFESRLNWDSPTPFFLCSQVLSFFFFRSRLNWDAPQPILSLLSCVLSLSLSCFFGHCLTGTHPFFLGCMFLGSFGVPIASSCYRCIEFTHLLHLMCPLFVMFESRLNWDSRNLFFFCSHVLSIFLFWSWLNWDPPQTILSLLSCVLSLSLWFCLVPA